MPCPTPSGCYDKFVFWKSTYIYNLCVCVRVNIEIDRFNDFVSASPCLSHQQLSGAKGLCCCYAQGEDPLDRINGSSEGYAFEYLKATRTVDQPEVLGGFVDTSCMIWEDGDFHACPVWGHKLPVDHRFWDVCMGASFPP